LTKIHYPYFEAIITAAAITTTTMPESPDSSPSSIPADADRLDWLTDQLQTYKKQVGSLEAEIEARRGDSPDSLQLIITERNRLVGQINEIQSQLDLIRASADRAKMQE
jgi:3-dehydroquinate dehydratase